MPFYRCMPPASSGGGGGGSSDDYVKLVYDNGEIEYPKIATNAIFENNQYIMNDATLYIGNNISSVNRLFYNARLMNYNIVFNTNSLQYAQFMCGQTNNFNRPVVFPNSVIEAPSAFINSCFNSKVTISENTYNVYGMFFHTKTYNVPIYVPYIPKGGKILYAGRIASNSLVFNSPILIESNSFMLNNGIDNSKNFASDVIINNTILNTVNVASIFRNTSPSLTKRIYIHNLNKITDLTSANTVIGAAITWTATTNGYYNAANNIYILNNVSDAANNFWNAYNQI